MMLTKEECLKAVEKLKLNGRIACVSIRNSRLIEQLIEEHFELVDAMNHFSDEVMEYIEENRRLRENLDILRINPSLDFEELKEDMWVWDNKRKEWCKFLCWCVFEYLDGYDDKFEENRFYRKQVEEC